MRKIERKEEHSCGFRAIVLAGKKVVYKNNIELQRENATKVKNLENCCDVRRGERRGKQKRAN